MPTRKLRYVWLDDERPAPHGCEHFKEAQPLITALADLDYWSSVRWLSLDHDLGDILTGFNVVQAILEHVMVEGRQCPFQIRVHSQNPVGRQLMEQSLKRYGIGQPDCVSTTEGIVPTHLEGQCKGQHCVVHNPSDHHMVSWPLHWRGDRGLMERVCVHGMGHPDPDHLAFVTATQGVHAAYDEGIHGCDGCCHGH